MIYIYFFLRCYIFKPFWNDWNRNSSEIKALTARDYCCRQLLQFCCSKNKYDMGGRFFKRFQQSVNRADWEHMYLIDNINSVFYRWRRINYIIAYRTYVLNSVVACGVHFNYICNRTAFDSGAGAAFSAWISVYRRLAVYRFGKNLRAGSLSRSAWSAEQICVWQLFWFNLIS